MSHNLLRKEIYNYLNTVTIKFDILGYIKAQRLHYDYNNIDMDDRTTWPYYLNMIGEYHSSDTIMHIMSLDTGKELIYNKLNLFLNPITNSKCIPGNKLYDDLCAKYPTQTELIKSIRYPVKNIDTAIQANDFDLLAGDTTFLYSTERFDLEQYVQSYIKAFSTKWYIPTLHYEEFYPLAFWAIMMYQLPLALISRRVYNMGTPSVHTFYIWEYLTSKGIDDYSDILDNDQAMFLYRNIAYLYGSKGTEETLKILAKNILNKLKVSLVGKSVTFDNTDLLSTCLGEPHIVSEDIVTGKIDYDKFDDISSFINRLCANGYDKDYSIDYINKIKDKLSSTTKEGFKTKYVELKKYDLDNKYELVLMNFMLDTLMNKVAKNKIDYLSDYYNEETNILIENIRLKDLVVFYYYTLRRSMGDHKPTKLPNKYVCNHRYIHDTPPDDYPKVIYYDGRTRNISDFIDVDKILETIPFYNKRTNSLKELSDSILEQFKIYLRDIIYCKYTGHIPDIRAMKSLYSHLMPREVLTLNLSEHTTYNEWFIVNDDIKKLVDELERNNTPIETFSKLTSDLVKLMIPVADDRFDLWLSMDKNNSVIYERIKKLFIQLCSYDVTFLDTDRNDYIYLTVPSYRADITSTGADIEIISVGDMLDSVKVVDYCNEPVNINENVSVSIATNESTTVPINNDITVTMGTNDILAVDIYKHSVSPSISQNNETHFIKNNVNIPVGIQIGEEKIGE